MSETPLPEPPLAETPTPEKPLLEATDVTGGYVAAVDILHGVSMHVHEGEIVTMIGPNGAGKSTFLKFVVGLMRPRQGTIRFDGDDIVGMPPHMLAQRGIGYVPQTDNVFPSLTVRENLEMGGYRLDRAARDERIDSLVERFPALATRAGTRAGSLSGGQRQLLALGRALMVEPRLLCLDEPTAGLAPLAVVSTFQAIEQIQASGVAVFMVEQNARMALGMSDRAYVLDTGRNAHQGAGPALLDDPRVTELYLGGAAAAPPRA